MSLLNVLKYKTLIFNSNIIPQNYSFYCIFEALLA